MLEPGYYWARCNADTWVVSVARDDEGPDAGLVALLPGSLDAFPIEPDGTSSDPDFRILGPVASLEDGVAGREASARLALLRDPPADGWRIAPRSWNGDGDGAVFATLVLDKIGGLGPEDQRLVLAAAYGEILASLHDMVELRGGAHGNWRVQSLYEAYDLEREENSALRKNLAWLAGRPGVAQADRLELSRRIRNWGADTYVCEDTAEEDATELLRVKRSVELLCDLVQEAIEAQIPEAPERGPAQPACDSSGRQGCVRGGWTELADRTLNGLRPFTVAAEPETLAEVRELAERRR